MLLDNRAEAHDLDSGRIRAWADRHTGVGFDQLIELRPPSASDHALQYRFYNADGSQAEQCGNGQRAIAEYLHSQDANVRWPLALDGPGGPVVLDRQDAERIAVTFQRPTQAAVVDLQDIGLNHGVRFDMGNPHLVVPVADVDAVDFQPLHQQILRQHPEDINIEVMQALRPGEIKVRVHERGCGETRACGSGACAAAVAAHHLWSHPAEVAVQLPGGVLFVHVHAHSGHLTLQGPARHVYQGEIDA